MVEPLTAAHRDAVVAGKPFFTSGLDELFALPEKKFFEVNGRGRVAMRDVSVLLGLFAERSAFPRWIGNLIDSGEAQATGRLRVRVLEPANATINSNFSTGKYVEDGARYRIDVQGGTTGYVVELSEI